MNKFAYLVLAIMAFGAVSCSKSSETYPSATIEDYAPLQVGKYVTYRLDSTVTTNFGAAFEVHTYEAKFVVDAQITDNLGRPAYRIFRYIRQNSGGSWVPDNTFIATNTGTSFEFVENNLRFIKLKLPIKDNFSWKGNSYIESTSINTDLMYLYDWDYFYENTYQPATVGSFTLDSTITVNQREDSVGVPITPETQYAEKNISKEIYAKNIGMVYRNFLHWEFQRVNNSYSGYGVTYTLIDHN